jgi:hypothetical protein
MSQSAHLMIGRAAARDYAVLRMSRRERIMKSKLKVYGEAVIAVAVVVTIVIGLTSGFSLAHVDVAPVPAQDAAVMLSQPASVADVPGDAGARPEYYSASGEGSFRANGDLIGGRQAGAPASARELPVD